MKTNLVMYKIDRRGGGVQKSFSRSGTNAGLILKTYRQKSTIDIGPFWTKLKGGGRGSEFVYQADESNC